ncbi:hypothetical protein ACHRVZ_01725 [Flavobacterium sp. FlaQc-57]|uniref:hypothetical protein n=1 Tax=Flavobacterium sp. FlaQc-57 TaxID=3374186 RepID=UPI0037577B6E
MRLKSFAIFFGYLKQLLLVVGLLYAFSNCQVKKTILHFASIESPEVSQKNQTQLPVQESCSNSILKKNSITKKAVSVSQIPSISRIQPFYFEAKECTAFNKLQIPSSFEFNKKSITYPALFIVFKNIKIAPSVVSNLA